jgi:L-seryl-tRNA(Ser) seleniumtransferase
VVRSLESLDKQLALKEIPPVNDLLEKSEVKRIIEKYGKQIVQDKIRNIIEEFRKAPNIYLRNDISEYIVNKLNECMDDYKRIALKKVINATGIVLHTNLGRAPLPKEAINIMVDIAEGYSNLEYDIEVGVRGSRYSYIEQMLQKITGAESAMVVNNNAAAVFLCLNTLASNKEVIISRGQQVEIGGSFRIPDIIARSSAKMMEVGTTNKTRVSDYSNAITEETAVLLKVHTSNYKITGFTEEVSLEQLSVIGKENNLLVMEDLGSGSLYDLSKIGLPYEPTVQDSIKNGADVVTFSGDKLLGGPQAGIIVGKKELIDKLKKNPLTRMLRCDKLTLAALTSVLNLYTDIDKIVDKIPVIKMMSLKEDELLLQAVKLEKLIKYNLSNKYKIEIVEDFDEVGGGSLPNVILKGKALAITSDKISANDLQEKLRKSEIPIICHIRKDRVLLNVRTLQQKDFGIIVNALDEVVGE